MTLSEIVRQIREMAANGHTFRQLVCGEKTFDELLSHLGVPEPNRAAITEVFIMGVEISHDPNIPEGRFYPWAEGVKG